MLLDLCDGASIRSDLVVCTEYAPKQYANLLLHRVFTNVWADLALLQEVSQSIGDQGQAGSGTR